MTAEEFRNLAQGVQAILVSIGALLAGGWAIYRFRSLLTVKKAQAELGKINTEVAKSKADLQKLHNELDAHPSIQVAVDTALVGTRESGDLCLRVNIVLHNTGNTPEYVDWTKSTIKAAVVTKIAQGKPQFGPTLTGILGRIDEATLGERLWPDETAVDVALIPIERHGLYLIIVSIKASERTADAIKSATLENPSNGDIVFETPVYFDARNNVQVLSPES